MAALLMLMRLCEKEHTVEYMRTICMALVAWRAYLGLVTPPGVTFPKKKKLAWRQWNDTCPGVCYSEEPRLDTVCSQYPRHVESSAVEDLFLAFMGPGRKGIHIHIQYTYTIYIYISYLFLTPVLPWGGVTEWFFRSE